MWLNEIEAKTMDAHMDMGPNDTPENSWCACYEEDVPRMAHVLRELAGVIKVATSPEYEDGEWNFIAAIDNLSDDARELIGEGDETG